MSETAPAVTEPKIPSPTARKRKAFWTRQFYLWHWVSSALCLASMLFFAFTGITLNHAADIPAKPVVNERKLTLPAGLLGAVALEQGAAAEKKAPLPAPVAEWLGKELRQKVADRGADWSEFEIYLSLPRPGGDAWLTIDRESGAVTHELTRRGVISYLNDLHKGRHTGPGWAWFLDIFSGACVIFSLTGLGLLWVHARRRPSTWPVVAAGVLVPVLIVIFLVH
ncbi:MAG: PepSY-associated helix protein [Verrucomicrobiales bacterium]|nr:PepSY-associated helix protein [Verrucomicrobiales bacterium]